MQVVDSILALDVGSRRIGVALANNVARLAHPLTTLEQSPRIIQDLRDIIEAENVGTLVVGLPRGLDGQETAQTHSVQAFAERLEVELKLPIIWQDEALTSVKAEAELKDHPKTAEHADVDSLAATYILEDYLQEHQEVHHAS